MIRLVRSPDRRHGQACSYDLGYAAHRASTGSTPVSGCLIHAAYDLSLTSSAIYGE